MADMKTELALLMLYDQPVLSREQVAELMGVKRETMSNMLSAESVAIPMFKVGPRWCAHNSDVAQYIDAQREMATKKWESNRI